MLAVFDSSPLIFLSGLNIAEQALELFTDVAVPAYVQEEVLRKADTASEKLQTLLDAQKIKVVQAKNTRMVEALRRKLGKGESEAIVAAVERSADLVVLDDRAARIEAVSVGLNVKGTLGIIRRLIDLGVVKFELDRLYQDLSALKFRVSRNIFDDIFSEPS
ncbi:MAG: hypothetical protein PHS17_02710 [Desulfobacterales bacterium]|nr:hypothetical protein [Desulfobacterales bacterium]